jgi:membrane fusion protein (multidrug efflux system)
MDSTTPPTHDGSAAQPDFPDRPTPEERSHVVPIVIVALVLAVLVVGGLLVWRAESKINKVALASSPKPVTVIAAREARFRDSRTYVGTLRPWIESSVGPQYLSVYVDTVLVRPGAVVRRGDVLATLDCRNASASSQAVAAEARSIDARQQAAAHESARVQTLLDGGFVSPNEAELKLAQSSSEEAQLAAQRAKLSAMGLQVNDCIMRAPFDGEIATRTVDPGAFVRPGTSIVSVVDRDTIRMTFDVPESDYDLVAPGTLASIHLIATNETVSGAITRRSPSADPDTRTAHVEIDLADPKREIPVNTTGEVRVEVGEPIRAIMVPLAAASITGSKAALFVVDGEVVHQSRLKILGEVGSDLFVEPTIQAGTPIVTEGWSTLAEGEHVATKQVPYEGGSSSGPPAEEGAPTEVLP